MLLYFRNLKLVVKQWKYVSFLVGILSWYENDRTFHTPHMLAECAEKREKIYEKSKMMIFLVGLKMKTKKREFLAT